MERAVVALVGDLLECFFLVELSDGYHEFNENCFWWLLKFCGVTVPVVKNYYYF